MRRTSIALILFMAPAVLAFAFSPDMAAEPQEVIESCSSSPPGESRGTCSAGSKPDGSRGNSMRIAGDGATDDVPEFSAAAMAEHKAPGYIFVDKVTDPRHDTQVFNFTLTGGPDDIVRAFQLRDDSDFAPYRSGRLRSGSYIVSEAEASEWTLTDIILVDPDAESQCNIETSSVTIDVDPGEEVLVIFKSTKK